MPNLHARDSGKEYVGTLLVLTDERAQSRVEIAPQRGAIVTSFQVRGRELLYLEADTLLDASKNVRGGIPVLFPAPGRLRGDVFTRDGKTGSMKQHGFARNMPWTPSTTADASRAEVALTLTADERTRALYPWDFSTTLTFSLHGARLSIQHRVHNTGEVTLPFALGYHPYFVVTDKRSADVETAATRAYDNVTKTLVPFSGFDLTLPEVDLYLLDHGSSTSALQLGDRTRIEVVGSAAFTRFVVWTVAGKDYVCLEPWTAALDALNTGEGLTLLPPGAVCEGQVDIAWVE
ncbi:MAG: hypothetical protein RLZZ450_3454 [Pseudomonadota bacterium]|jgi:galactose mutarotase-like enzyme